MILILIIFIKKSTKKSKKAQNNVITIKKITIHPIAHVPLDPLVALVVHEFPWEGQQWVWQGAPWMCHHQWRSIVSQLFGSTRRVLCCIEVEVVIIFYGYLYVIAIKWELNYHKATLLINFQILWAQCISLLWFHLIIRLYCIKLWFKIIFPFFDSFSQ